MYRDYWYFCLSPSLKCRLHEGRDWFSLLITSHPKSPTPGHSRGISQMDEWMKELELCLEGCSCKDLRWPWCLAKLWENKYYIENPIFSDVKDRKEVLHLPRKTPQWNEAALSTALPSHHLCTELGHFCWFLWFLRASIQDCIWGSKCWNCNPIGCHLC